MNLVFPILRGSLGIPVYIIIFHKSRINVMDNIIDPIAGVFQYDTTLPILH